VSLVDRMILPGAGGLPRPESPTYATALTGIYAGESGVARVTNPDLTSWWRGQSTRNSYSPFRESGGIAIVPTVQAAAGGDAGSQRGNPLVSQPMGLWTFRTFCDYSMPRAGTGASRVGGRIDQDEDSYRVLVTGLPDGAKVMAAALRMGSVWLSLEEPDDAPPAPQPRPGAYMPPTPARTELLLKPIGTVEDGAWSVAFPRRYSAEHPPREWSPFVRHVNEPWFYNTNAPVDERPGPLLELQGPNRRGLAIESYLATGRWAALYLSLDDCPTGLELNWPAKADHTMILRLLMPIDNGESRP
jgi:hypothetical protein